MNALALLYLSETADVPNKSARGAVGWLSKAAYRHEDAEARSNLGVCHQQGVGTPQDDDKAKNLFLGGYSVRQQHFEMLSPFNETIACCRRRQPPPPSPDSLFPGRGPSFLGTVSAEAGFAEGQANYASMLSTNLGAEGATNDEWATKEVLKYYGKAAAQGHMGAAEALKELNKWLADEAAEYAIGGDDRDDDEDDEDDEEKDEDSEEENLDKGAE